MTSYGIPVPLASSGRRMRRRGFAQRHGTTATAPGETELGTGHRWRRERSQIALMPSLLMVLI
jgi:hypothetical protein